MEQRDDHWHGELPVEPQRHVDDDQEDGEREREQRAAEDLAAERGRHRAHVDLLGQSKLLVDLLLDRLHLVGGDLLGVNLERRVRRAARVALTTDDRAAQVAVCLNEQRLDLVRRCRLGGDDRHARATGEVEPQIEAADGKGADADDDGDGRDDEEQPLAPSEVEAPAHGLRLGTDHARIVEPREVREHAEDRARRDDRGKHRDQHTDREQEGEAFDARLRGNEQHASSDQRDGVGIQDGAEAARVARGDRGLQRLARAELLADAFEDHDVGVCRHANRENHARDTWQRHGDRYGKDHAVEQRGEDDECEGRDDTEHAVEDDQVQHHQQQADETSNQALAQGFSAERGRDLARRERHEAHRQRARLEHECDVTRFLRRVQPGDLGSAPSDAIRVLNEIDGRVRLETAVKDDREALEVR